MVVSGNFFDMLNNVVMIGNELDFNAWSNYIGGIDLKIRGLTISGE
jgi:predicted Zn-dependent protease